MKTLQDLINNFGELVEESIITNLYNDLKDRYKEHCTPELLETIAHQYACIELVKMTKPSF